MLVSRTGETAEKLEKKKCRTAGGGRKTGISEYWNDGVGAPVRSVNNFPEVFLAFIRNR
jgi:hypothetical protein